MPDLSSLPSELIGPFALVFALALFVSKIFDIVEKWRSLRSSGNTESEKTQTKGETIAAPVNTERTSPSNDRHENLSAKEIFLYSFLGAIVISALSTIMKFIFIDASEYLESQLFSLAYTVFFGAVSAVICTFFIRHKFPLIAQNKVVPVLMGLGISALLSMPVGTIMTIVQINKIYG